MELILWGIIFYLMGYATCNYGIIRQHRKAIDELRDKEIELQEKLMQLLGYADEAIARYKKSKTEDTHLHS